MINLLHRVQLHIHHPHLLSEVHGRWSPGPLILASSLCLRQLSNSPWSCLTMAQGYPWLQPLMRGPGPTQTLVNLDIRESVMIWTIEMLRCPTMWPWAGSVPPLFLCCSSLKWSNGGQDSYLSDLLLWPQRSSTNTCDRKDSLILTWLFIEANNSIY